MKDYKLTEKVIGEKIYYYASFIDGEGHVQLVEIDEGTYLTIKQSQIGEETYERKRRRYGVCSFNDAIGIEDIRSTDDDSKEFYEELDRLLASLTETQKRRFEMRYFQNMDIEEIAKIEEARINAVWESLELAKKKMKNLKKFI
jgi:hypothetical protein